MTDLFWLMMVKISSSSLSVSFIPVFLVSVLVKAIYLT